MQHMLKQLAGIPLLLLIITSSSFSPFAAAAARDSIVPGHPLTPGDSIVSPGGRFALGFFTPSGANSTGGLYVGIWYNNIPVQTVVWVANRRNPIANTTNATLSISIHGTLTISGNSSSPAVWSTEIQGLISPAARLLDDGNLVVLEASSPAAAPTYAWQSFDDPTDTLLPGMKLGLAGGLNLNLTSWRSAGDPSPGDFTLSMDLRGDPQLTLWSAGGTSRLWRSGPWTGSDFSALAPQTETYTGFVFSFVGDADNFYYSYSVSDPSIVTLLVINSTGMTQRFVWIDGEGGGGSWNLFWYTPKTQCDRYAPCGQYGICDPNGSPPCSCLPGFVPRSPAKWDLRDGSDGCVRKTELDCGMLNGSAAAMATTTDGFATMGRTMLPDTVEVVVDRGIDLGECRRRCSANCSCTGYANADVHNGGSGCILWVGPLTDIEVFVAGGQDFFYRLAVADLPEATGNGHRGSRHVAIIAVLSTVFGALFVICMIYCYLWRRKIRRALDVYSKNHTNQTHHEEDLELPLFDYVAIKAATNTFSIENKLGEGGFGPVYKGRFLEGQEIAVKMLAKTSVQGIDEFKNEVKLMAKLQHRNLVRLLGCCIHENERMLIYEYMPNKSLDAFLFEEQGRALLDWVMRYRIIEGIARGLLYLHQDSRFRIIHRDLKASNILLDKDMTPKISDFGLARTFGGEETRERTRRVVGTYGYMAPEYAMNGIFSVKSDVFSFGVVVLEIISGKRNKGVYLSEPDEYLLGSAWRSWREGNGAEIADPSMDNVFAVDELRTCLKVGLLCVQELPEDRPNMASVLLMLSSDSSSLPEPKKPGFAVRQVSSSQQDPDSSSSVQQQQHSMNHLSYTMAVAR